MSLLKRTNELNSCAVSGAADRGKFVGRDRTGGQSTSLIEPQSHPTSRVHAASWAVGILDPYEDFGDSVCKSTDCCANASPNNSQKIDGQVNASSLDFQFYWTASRRLIHERIHSRYPFF
jgi:hypothetical protein